MLGLDAGSGRSIWHYQRRRTRGIGGTAAAGVNRGVAVAGDRVFMVTDNAHVIALDRSAGTLLWDSEMADWRQNYYATTAPLIAGGLVLAGVAGGDDGVRGFVAAFDAMSGKEVWRFWTVPKPGEPGSETWNGKDISHPGGVTWLTGTYDPAMGIVYWPTGNAGNDLNGDTAAETTSTPTPMSPWIRRPGKLKWHLQYTPHDVWDWDAVQTPVLVDQLEWTAAQAAVARKSQRIPVRSGSDVREIASGQAPGEEADVGERDRCQRPADSPSRPGTHRRGREDLPTHRGRHELVLHRVHSGNRLYYVQTLEKCGIYTKSNTEWKAGGSFMGGTTRNIPDDNSRKVLRAFDIHTGEVAWECRSLATPSPGAEFSAPLGAWSSLAMTMDRWPPLTRIPASDYGASRRAACGKHPR